MNIVKKIIACLSGKKEEENCMTLYRGQKSMHDDKLFVPDLLRNDNIPRLEKEISETTNISDLKPYKQVLSGYTVLTPPCQLLHKELADENHLYYFFLSMVNIGLKIHQNPIFSGYVSGYIDQFITYTDKSGTPTLVPPDIVQKNIATRLAIDSVFYGEYLKDYSVFQHLNFIFPGEFPTLLLDWTSDIDIAAYFSKDESGNLGTVVSIKWPNELFRRPLCHNSGTTNVLMHQTDFYNVSGYVCDNYDCGCETRTVNMSNDKQYLWQVHKFLPGFNQSLITLQKATCLYWPYQYKLEQLNSDMKDVLGFKILSTNELRERITSKGGQLWH